MIDRSPINVMQPEWEAGCYFRPSVMPQGLQGAPDPWARGQDLPCALTVSPIMPLSLGVTNSSQSEAPAVTSAPASECLRPYYTLGSLRMANWLSPLKLRWNH